MAEYKDPDILFADIARTYRDAVGAFYAAGCRYLQMDDIFFAYLGDEKQREQRRAMGQDPDWLIDRYAWMLDEAIKDRPADMTIGMHMCRGNFRSTYAASGGYDAAADAIFNKTGVDVYFMEYDTDRAGGLEPLKLLPRGNKRIMAGFITTKTPRARADGRAQAPLRRGVEVRRHRPAWDRTAMRLRLDRGGQRHHRRRPAPQAGVGGALRRGDLGRGLTPSPAQACTRVQSGKPLISRKKFTPTLACWKDLRTPATGSFHSVSAGIF